MLITERWWPLIRGQNAKLDTGTELVHEVHAIVGSASSLPVAWVSQNGNQGHQQRVKITEKGL